MPQALTHARCLVWQAQLYALPIQGVNTPLFDEEEGTFLHWDIHLHSIANSRDWLPLDYRDEDSFVDTLNRARFPDDQEALNQRSIHALKSGHSSYNQSFRVRLKDGTIRWLLETVEVCLQEANHWGLTGVWVDITDQKDAEERLGLLMRSARCLVWQSRVELLPITSAEEERIAQYQGMQETGTYFAWEEAVVPDEAAAQRWLPLLRRDNRSYAADLLESRDPDERAKAILICTH